ncbi:hypothetical protein FXF51_42680 [Nonomuraea sp. PA05]|uniref:hypothetical protein n=1 Tax=Nonomuraea sp. PA05 TaxID=2604466 RepID=UPI0011D71397|nr:hypothetical protein [Nonomuraea sp. PA05]TYB56815.1 hypothetical protein FXF51_42680 [Nonomuraea sp. PA05]
MPYRHPYTGPDLQEVVHRHRTAEQLIATFARSTPALSDLWQDVTAALHDIPTLVQETRRLRREVTTLRLSRANYLAAINATLNAHADGEPNALAYLRDELADQARTPRPEGGRA